MKVVRIAKANFVDTNVSNVSTFLEPATLVVLCILFFRRHEMYPVPERST